MANAEAMAMNLAARLERIAGRLGGHLKQLESLVGPDVQAQKATIEEAATDSTVGRIEDTVCGIEYRLDRIDGQLERIVGRLG